MPLPFSSDSMIIAQSGANCNRQFAQSFNALKFLCAKVLFIGLFVVGQAEDIIGAGAVILGKLDDDLNGHDPQPAFIFRVKRLIAVEIFTDFLLGFIVVFSEIPDAREEQHNHRPFMNRWLSYIFHSIIIIISEALISHKKDKMALHIRYFINI